MMDFRVGGKVTNRRTHVVETIENIYICPIRHSMVCKFVSGAVLHKAVVFREYT